MSRRPYMAPIVVELHDDGAVRVYAEDRDVVSVRVVNRPADACDVCEADINEGISRLVSRQLPWLHRQVYENGWCIADGYKETWTLQRILERDENLRIMEAIERATVEICNPVTGSAARTRPDEQDGASVVGSAHGGR